MQDFFNKLYGIENFTTYILITVSILLILFLLILFLGKKDQKLEKTKRLAKLSEDAFKEESEAVQLDVAKENIDILIPPTNSIEPVQIKEPSLLPDDSINMVTEEVSEPILEEVKEMPLNISEDVNIFEIEPLKTESEEEVKEVVKDEIEIPEFNFDDLVTTFNEEEQAEVVNEPEINEELNKKSSATPIFSSVYINKKAEAEKEPVIIKIADSMENEETETKIAPIKFEEEISPIKFEEEISPIKIEEEISPIKIEEETKADEEEIILPKLKDSVKKEDLGFSFDSFQGESYNIKK